MKFDLPFYTEITVKDDDMQVQMTSYSNGSPKVSVISYSEGPYASLGKPSFPVLDGNLMILDNSLPEYKSIINALVADGILSLTDNTYPSGYNRYPIYMFNGTN